MSAHLACDKCHQPKESTSHYSLIQHVSRAAGHGSRRSYSGSIDLCDDCRDMLSHDGRDGVHKRMATVRIEMGKVSR